MGKPNIVKFTATILPHYPLAVECAGKFIKGTRTVRPLGTQTDNHLNWKSHTHQILPKLSAACFAVTRLLHVLNIGALRMVHFAFVPSVCMHGIIWGENC
jgi:hypothetical protein